jgi:hypothetical protein
MKGSLPISLGVKHRGHSLSLKIENRPLTILEQFVIENPADYG